MPTTNKRLRKPACKYATTGPIDLTTNGLAAVDSGVILEDDRIWVWLQADGRENGAYNAHAASAWTRTDDFNQSEDFVSGCEVPILDGELYKNRIFQVVTDDPISLGVTVLESQDITTMLNLEQAPCVVSGGVIGVGAHDISIGDSMVRLRIGGAFTAELKSFRIAGVTLAIPLTNTIYYLCCEYNAGTPQWVLRASSTELSNGLTTEFFVAVLIDDTIAGAVKWNEYATIRPLNTRTVDNTLRRMLPIQLSAFKDNGNEFLKMSDKGAGSHAFLVEQGRLYIGSNEYIFNDYDSSVTAFNYWSYSGAGWAVSSANVIDIAQYNNTGVGLAALTNHKADLVFINPKDSKVHVVYGQTDTDFITAANLGRDNLVNPSLPEVIDKFCVFVGTICVQTGVTAFKFIRRIAYNKGFYYPWTVFSCGGTAPSAGATDMGKLVKTNAAGTFDATFLPGAGVNTDPSFLIPAVDNYAISPDGAAPGIFTEEFDPATNLSYVNRTAAIGTDTISFECPVAALRTSANKGKKFTKVTVYYNNSGAAIADSITLSVWKKTPPAADGNPIVAAELISTTLPNAGGRVAAGDRVAAITITTPAYHNTKEGLFAKMIIDGSATSVCKIYGLLWEFEEALM